MDKKPLRSPASLRWAILRKSLLPHPPSSSPNYESDRSSEVAIKKISRKAAGGFNLIPCRPLDELLVEGLGASNGKVRELAGDRDACLYYELPSASVPGLILIQRRDDCLDLNDFEMSKRYDIDTTGLVCSWPSEEVLAYFCINHSMYFRSKRIIEVGSGYGLAGLAIAATSNAHEVVISDGNPQVVDYIQRNISANASSFGATKVKAMTLHWNQEQTSDIINTFDIIIASDCTFFKQFHRSLASTVKCLLKPSKSSEAIFMSPRRGDTLDMFLAEAREMGLQYELVTNYDEEVRNVHERLLKGDESSWWPAYDKDHCYPLMVRITFAHENIFED